MSRFSRGTSFSSINTEGISLVIKKILGIHTKFWTATAVLSWLYAGWLLFVHRYGNYCTEYSKINCTDY